MTTDEVLGSLRKLEKPALRPFLTTRLTVSKERAAMPVALRLYWALVVLASVWILGASWAGVAVLIAAGAIAAFPEVALRVTARLLSAFSA